MLKQNLIFRIQELLFHPNATPLCIDEAREKELAGEACQIVDGAVVDHLIVEESSCRARCRGQNPSYLLRYVHGIN